MDCVIVSIYSTDRVIARSLPRRTAYPTVRILDLIFVSYYASSIQLNNILAPMIPSR
jgi:hypothetical protein